jgi:hypothetical protein
MLSIFTRTAHLVRIRSAMRSSAVCAGLLGMSLIPGPASAQPASAQPIRQGAAPRVKAKGPPQCGANEICLYPDSDYQGDPWRWTRRDGYRDVPPNLHDNVGSFIANIAGCFIDWKVPGRKGEFRKVPSGSYSSNWGGEGFGSRLDALQVYSRCH